MSWTKRQLIEKAFDKIGMASYVYDLTPDQFTSALYEMDAMLNSWQTIGIYLGYPVYSLPQESNLDELSNIPAFANLAVYLNLAILIAPSYGKQVLPDLLRLAKNAYESMLNNVGMVYWEVQMPATLPRGQGTKPWRNFNNPFITPHPEPIFTGPDSILEISPVIPSSS